ncbi:hypothetical protein FRC02_010055 [Tulasnella sp. 418]|nr:hypothetical protein FRC02_010055 [Tulasnella sp. 418]
MFGELVIVYRKQTFISSSSHHMKPLRDPSCGAQRGNGLPSTPPTPRSASSSSTSPSLGSSSSLSSFDSSKLDAIKQLSPASSSAGFQRMNGFPSPSATPSPTNLFHPAKTRPPLSSHDSIGATTVYATPIPTPSTQRISRTVSVNPGLMASADVGLSRLNGSQPSLQVSASGNLTAVLNPSPLATLPSPFPQSHVVPLRSTPNTPSSLDKPFFSPHTPQTASSATLSTSDSNFAFPYPRQLTPSGRAVGQGGVVRNISGDDKNAIMMFWPDNEPLPDKSQVRPPMPKIQGGAPPPILNTGNSGPMTRQALDWECGVCRYVVSFTDDF